jgi:hypothetical protein
MKLIRNGVFETNSSSAHSLAYKNNVLRDYNYKPCNDLCFAVKELHLTKKPKEYEMYSYMPLYFDEYGWGFDVLSSPAEKLSYLMSSVYQYKTWGEMYNDSFFRQIVQWLTELGIKLEYEYPGDDERIDGYVDHQSYDVVCKQMFNSKEDLLTYLFNDEITVHIENDNDDFQEWVEDPKGEIGYQEAMYYVCSRGKCVKRKSWDDNTCVYSDLVYSHDKDYLGQAVIKACDESKWLYAASTSDVNANDWITLWEVNKYAINKK